MKILKLLEFLLFYAGEVLVSNLRVARDVLSPRLRATPAILEIPLAPGLTDLQAFLLASLVTMTPGTLTIDLSADKRLLTIHAMFAGDPAQTITELQQHFERRVRDVF